MSSHEPRLLVGLPLQPDESIPSFVQRHCEANAVLKVGDLLRLVSEIAKQAVRNLRQLVCSAAAMSALEKLTRAPAGTLQDRVMWPIDGAHGPLVRQGEHQWPEDARVSAHQAVCPLCLAGGGYGLTSWDFVQAPACTRHGVALIEHCLRCKTRILTLRTTPANCETCGAPFGDVTPDGVSDATLRAAVLIQSASMAGLGNPGHTSPVSPRDLSDLLRLCVLPDFKQGVDYGLRTALSDIPIQARLSALETLGRAVQGRVIDAETLRPYLMRRWPHSGLLMPQQQRRLLAGACEDVGMLRDVTSLVCEGRDDLEPETAVRRFGLRVPRLHSRAEVAAFLKVGEHTVVSLERAGLRLTQPASGDGYDMDEVLALRRALQEAHTFEDVDRVLGLPALARGLAHVQLLHAIPVGDETLIHADSVTRLFASVQRGVESLDVGTGGMRLGDWARQVGSIEVVVAAVGWLAGGSLRIVAWNAPYRLADASVDAERLGELAHKRSASHLHGSRASSRSLQARRQSSEGLSPDAVSASLRAG